MPSYVAFNAWGEGYSPKKVPLRHTYASEPGEIAKIGRYKGKPTPYGTSRYVVPDSVHEKNRRRYLFRKIHPLLRAFKKAGATDWHVSIDRAYHAQCNDAFTQEEMRLFLKLRADLWYTAYEVSAREEAEMIAKYEQKKKKANKPVRQLGPLHGPSV